MVVALEVRGVRTSDHGLRRTRTSGPRHHIHGELDFWFIPLTNWDPSIHAPGNYKGAEGILDVSSKREAKTNGQFQPSPYRNL